MSDRTSVAMDEATKSRLDEVRTGDESYKSVINRLIDSHTSGGEGAMQAHVTEIEASERKELAREVAKLLR